MRSVAHSTSTTRPPESSSIYASRPQPWLVFFSSSLKSTASTSTGGFRPSMFARFHLLSLGIPMHGPNCDERSKCRRIFSWRGTVDWWTVRVLVGITGGHYQAGAYTSWCKPRIFLGFPILLDLRIGDLCRGCFAAVSGWCFLRPSLDPRL